MEWAGQKEMERPQGQNSNPALHGLSRRAAALTDLGFSYSARGEVTDAYQSTPHSNGYYRTSAAYWATV